MRHPVTPLQPAQAFRKIYETSKSKVFVCRHSASGRKVCLKAHYVSSLTNAELERVRAASSARR